MSKKYMIIPLALLILVLAVGGYYWKTKMRKPAPVVGEDISSSVSPVIEPAIETAPTVNPMESAQGANPYDKTNPYSNIKVNPFE